MYWFRRAPFLPVILNNVKDPRAQRSESTRQRSWREPAAPGGSSEVGLRPTCFARGFFAGSE